MTGTYRRIRGLDEALHWQVKFIEQSHGIKAEDAALSACEASHRTVNIGVARASIVDPGMKCAGRGDRRRCRIRPASGHQLYVTAHLDC